MDRPIELAGFVAGTGTYTGSEGGQNISVTGGVDAGFRRMGYRGFMTSFELRGTYPIYHGHIDSLSNVLGGVKVEKVIHRFHPYGEIGDGIGDITYARPDGVNGIPNPRGGRPYEGAASNVPWGGVGDDYDLNPFLAFKTEMMMEKYNTPVAISGHNWAMATTFAIVYRFGHRTEMP